MLGLRADALLVRVVNFGTERSGGGAYESHLLEMWSFDADGRLRAFRGVRRGPAAEALARFDALTAPPSAARRVRPNAATAAAQRVDAAVRARDVDALGPLFGGIAEVVEHATGAVYGGDALIATWGALLRSQNPSLEARPLASLGDSLALLHGSMSFTALGGRDVSDFGPVQRDELVLLEVDASGRQHRIELFASDRLYDAVARLYARHAELLPDGPERARAAATARTVATLARPDRETIGAVFAADLEYRDHRPLGFPSLRGAEAIRDWVRTLWESADDIVFRLDEIFELRPDAMLARFTNCGTDRTGGGSFERPFISLNVFGADGLLVRWEHFAADALEVALARFDALMAPPSDARFANAASRAVERVERRWNLRDWDGLVAQMATGFRMDDRRALVGVSLSGQDFLLNLRMMFAMTASRWQLEQIATRGERLALFRSRLSGEAREGGPVAFEHLSLVEVDAAERYASLVVFDLGDLDAAYAELERRFAAGEGAPYPELLANLESLRRNGPATQRAELARLLSEDFRFLSHRHLFYTRTPMGRDRYVDSFRDLGVLGVDTALRIDHLRVSDTALIADSLWSGTRDDGDFEQAIILVYSHDGRVFRSFDLYDADQLAAAQSRYEELSARPTSPSRIENAATRSAGEVQDAWETHDWERFSSVFAPRFRSIDRRKMVQLELDRDQHREFLRPNFRMASSRSATNVLATRGDRLALIRVIWEGADQSVGPSEVELIQVVEVDERGDQVALVMFDAADLDDAYAELDARFAAAEVAEGRRASLTSAFTGAFAARDWEALAALLAPDLVVEDHRRLGWETLRGPQAYIAALRSLVELAPDVRLRVDHAEMSDPGYLYFTSWRGTREGGAFEEPSWIVCELDAAGRIRGFEQYGEDQLDAARARLVEIGARRAPDLLRIPPNAASRTSDRFQECAAAADWDALRALYAPTFVWEDRRPLFATTGDREMGYANTRMIREAGARVRRERLATSGDRLVLERVRFARDAGSVWEVEALQLIEVDAEGRVVAAVFFDPDDRRAASAEMRERFLRGEGACFTSRNSAEALGAWHEHDLAGLRAALPDDFVFHDHRRTGTGRIVGADEYVRSVAALFEQSPDLSADTLYHVELDGHGSIAVARMFGTLIGGGAVESVFVRLSLHRAGQFVGMELFELEDLEQARARFEAARPPDPLQIPPNAASRTRDRQLEAFEARDWTAFESLCAATLRFDDRRRAVLAAGDRDTFVESARLMASAGARAARTALATAGDRLVLERILWAGAADGSAFEVEALQLIEVDDDGRIVASIGFDPDERRAASAELRERFLKSAAGRHVPAWLRELGRAVRDRDLARVRAVLPDDYVLHDHRRTGLGRLTIDTYVASATALLEQSPDASEEDLYYVATHEHGGLSVARSYGTLASGGEFESVFLRLQVYGRGEVPGTEFFELDDLEHARARFEALRRIPCASRRTRRRVRTSASTPASRLATGKA